MALVKFGGGITQMSGSIAGNTFARNSTSNYVRARTKPVNPNTSLQIAIRQYIAYFTQRWHDTLTSTQRGSWNAYAAAVAMKNKLGETTKLSGFNMYIRVNVFRYGNGNGKIDSCLGPTALPEKDSTFAVVAYASDNTIRVTFDTTLPWCAIPASILGVYGGQPQLVTRNYFGGPWKNAGPIPGNQVSPHTMAYPYTISTGQKIWVYSRISTGPLDGRLSEPMIASTTVAAAPP